MSTTAVVKCPFCKHDKSVGIDTSDGRVWLDCLGCKTSFLRDTEIGHWGDFLIDPEDGMLNVLDSEGQMLEVRVGQVYTAQGQDKVPGIWIGYQEQYMKSKLQGPFLLSPETWTKIKEHIDSRLEED